VLAPPHINAAAAVALVEAPRRHDDDDDEQYDPFFVGTHGRQAPERKEDLLSRKTLPLLFVDEKLQ